MASRQTAIRVQTPATGFTNSSHGTALVALPTVKNRLVVPAYTSLLRPRGSRYIANGGPPECATMVVIPEARPAVMAFGAERGRVITSTPATSHRPTKNR